ncbi:hypothetical protein [Rhizobium sp. CECT 9324]|uniref:rolling circle replication-associated protein n=1 Tax=Rhizobium sp. CECT 9324 TaxID=2845820 RepID=UPI001E40DEBA|nr:hypothetical protein [Rhizobium sp. CECT 9324]
MFLTLTYGRDEEGNESHTRSSILTYSDCQKYFKQLRKRGLKFRYLIVGEIGSKKGRTHWHILLFFQEELPDGFWDYGQNSWHRAKRKKREAVWVPLVWNKRFNEPCWPHGFSQWDQLHYGHEKGGVRYACKYINKDVDDVEAQSKLCMSKRPPIGAIYFDQLSMKLVDEGVSPQDAYYTFPNQAKRKNGTVIRFQLANKSSDLFCENYILNWRGLPKPWGRHGPPAIDHGRPWHYPDSEYVQEFEDRMNSDEFVADPEFLEWYNERRGKWLSVEKQVTKPKSAYLMQTEWLQARSNKAIVHYGHVVNPLFVLWISPFSKGLGRYKKAKAKNQSGQAVWLRSIC